MKDKYFLKTKGYGNDITHFIVRNQSDLEIELKEDVETTPCVFFAFNKTDRFINKRPKSSELMKYKPISKELYSNYYQLALKNLKSCQWDMAEYYLLKPRRGEFEIIVLSENPKNKFSICINCQDSIDAIYLDILKESLNHSSKIPIRKNGKPIPEAVFIAVLKETIKFLSDENSYEINIPFYYSQITKCLEGDVPEPTNESNVNVDDVVKQLEIKKTDLINRLIENDTDTELIRASLRGEKDGIDYALRTIRKYLKLV